MNPALYAEFPDLYTNNAALSSVVSEEHVLRTLLFISNRGASLVPVCVLDPPPLCTSSNQLKSEVNKMISDVMKVYLLNKILMWVNFSFHSYSWLGGYFNQCGYNSKAHSMEETTPNSINSSRSKFHNLPGSIF